MATCHTLHHFLNINHATGKRGYFPSDYVKVEELAKPPPPPPPPRKKLMAKVLFDYNPPNPESMRLKQGDIVEVITRGDPGGWSVGVNGAFPTDYVEFLPGGVSGAAAHTAMSTSHHDPFGGLEVPSPTPAPPSTTSTTTATTLSESKPLSRDTTLSSKDSKSSAIESKAHSAPVPPPKTRTTPSSTPAAAQTTPNTQAATAAKAAHHGGGGALETKQSAGGAGKVPPPPKTVVKKDYTSQLPQEGGQSAAVEVVATAFVDGKRPTWRRFLFLDLFADFYVHQMASPAGNVQGSNGISRAATSLQFVRQALNTLNLTQYPPCAHENTFTNVLVKANAMLNESIDLAGKISVRSADPTKLFAFLATLTSRMRRLAVDEYLLFPVSWQSHTGQGEHVVMILMKRIARDTHEDFSVAVVNTSHADGLSYHPMEADSADASIKYNMAFTIPRVQTERATNTTFW